MRVVVVDCSAGVRIMVRSRGATVGKWVVVAERKDVATVWGAAVGRRRVTVVRLGITVVDRVIFTSIGVVITSWGVDRPDLVAVLGGSVRVGRGVALVNGCVVAVVRRVGVLGRLAEAVLRCIDEVSWLRVAIVCVLVMVSHRWVEKAVV